MAAATSTADPVLSRFKAALTQAYGDRLDHVLLFGSRARGEAREDSDYDVAVFLKDVDDFWAESRRIGDLGYDVLLADGRVINAIPFAAGTLPDRTPIMFEIRRDGVEI